MFPSFPVSRELGGEGGEGVGAFLETSLPAGSFRLCVTVDGPAELVRSVTAGSIHRIAAPKRHAFCAKSAPKNLHSLPKTAHFWRASGGLGGSFSVFCAVTIVRQRLEIIRRLQMEKVRARPGRFRQAAFISAIGCSR
jgi:hypothetical protein